MKANYIHKDSTTLVQDETETYIKVPKNKIKFNSKEAEIIFDLTLENDELRLKNQELKKQVEERTKMYQNAYDYSQKMEGKAIILETQQKELKQQLENYKKLGFKHLQDKNNNLETQQKEFINYLEKEIKRINPNDLYIGELNLRLDDIKFTQYLIYKEILQKYKEIIGDDK